MCKKIYYAIFTIAMATMIIIGCKKADIRSEKSQPDIPDAEKLSRVQDWLKSQPNYVYHSVNQRLETYRTNNKGEIVEVSARPLSTGVGCEPFNEPSPTLEGWASFNSNCGSTPAQYSVYASFEISSENAIVYQDPNNPTSTSPSAKTRGRLAVTSTATGSVIYNAANIIVAQGDITLIGTDPLDPNRSLYRVTYLVQNVPETAVAGGTTIRLYITYYTECEEESQLSYNSVANIGNLSGVTACNVVNTVFVNPSLKSISGAAACASCCIPSVIPKFHYVRFVNISTGVEVYSNPTLGVTQTILLTNAQVPTGASYRVEYRNANWKTHPAGHPQQGQLILDGSGNPILECYGPWIQNPTIYVW